MGRFGVTFTNDRQDVSLKGILDVLGARAKRSSWRLLDVCTAGTASASEAFDAVAVRNDRVSGDRLFQVASAHGLQIIDGEFSAFEQGAVRPWTTVRAVDGRWWDVEASDAGVLRAFEFRFRDVIDLPR